MPRLLLLALIVSSATAQTRVETIPLDSTATLTVPLEALDVNADDIELDSRYREPLRVGPCSAYDRLTPLYVDSVGTVRGAAVCSAVVTIDRAPLPADSVRLDVTCLF